MNVKGKHVFQVDQATLWSYLMDPQVLEKITPGDTQLELIGDDQYRSNSNIKIGPVKGVFEGKLSVEDKVEPNSFVIKMQQNSKMGNAQGKIAMHLADQGAGTTELAFDGKANLSGMIARTGQRVLSGVANAITQEVFASLEGHIEAEKAGAGATASQASKGFSIWASILNFFKGLFSSK